MIIDKLSGSRVHFEVTVTPDKFEHALDHAFEEVIQKVEIKGFRKGKAPRNIYEAKYGVESLYEEAIQHALQDTYYETVTEHQINVVSQPKIDMDVAKVKRGTEFTYAVTVAVKPEVTLGEYLGLEIKAESEDVTDAEIDSEITKDLERHAEMVLKEAGELADGNTAVFDFVGSIDGVPFPGGTAENYELVIGSNQFIPGFEAQMLGMTPETEKDILVTFPEDYHEKSLANKEATFHVNLHEIKERVIPTLSDDFVKELNLVGITSVDLYKKDVYDRLKKAKIRTNENHIRNTVVEKAAVNATFDLPEEMIHEEVGRMDENNKRQIKQYNLDFDLYLQYLNKTKEAYEQELHDNAVKVLRQQLVIEAIGQAEKIEADPDEIEQKYGEIAEQYQNQNISLDQVKQAIPESAIKDEVVYKKAIDLLVEKAKITR
ncbi:MAG: trigger factor [Candidatus Izemoplasmatales bacterium]|nr:trigger factor [Candidatus Izemoplasmatales bacterium]